MTDVIRPEFPDGAPLEEGAPLVTPPVPTGFVVGPFRVLTKNDTTEIPDEHRKPLEEP